ncbi:unnamed protein product [Caenorhabditis bovis]|uniref:Triokinase/FMN cyclase n=1 Tax=Caenorhabditis bovis TaxID=2654633 RepID=A0A8S1E7W0_9PELO|nr:unnamed protein product [Caenorhabditis bovis]
MSKKFVNSPNDVVDDTLYGLVLTNCGLKFHPEINRVILRSDIEEYSKSKVALIAGGGSGHEPYAAGYVGEGMLTAAVAGNLFASPPSHYVLSALNATKSSSGAILIVINYTGDRLHFGLAAERFSGNVKVLTIGDDVAIENPSNRVGRRGLAGAVLAIKIAGAMAEQGKSQDEIYNLTKFVADNVATLGVSLYPCNLPGKRRESHLKEDQIEIGMGIHGEPGKEKAQYTNAAKIVNDVLETLKRKCGLQVGDQLIVMINELGSVCPIEMSIVSGEVVLWFKTQNMVIKRLYRGPYMTSIDAHGISITVLRSNDELLTYLDYPTKASGWIPAININQFQSASKPKASSNNINIAELRPVGGIGDSDLISKILSNLGKAMVDSEEKLNNLDGAAGDGDCGSTFVTASKSLEKARSVLNISHPQTLLQQIALIFEQAVGGTCGALYALMLSSAASCFEKEVKFENVAEAFKKATYAVQKYGGAKPGDRTMVDSLDAAVKALSSYTSSKCQWSKVAQVVEDAAEKTIHQTATVGRASYTSKDAQTLPDAGATAIAIWIRVIADTIESHSNL